MVLKTELSRDSGVQTDFDDARVLHYKSESSLCNNGTHVQLYGAINNEANFSLLPRKSKCSKAKALLTKWSIEPFMFLFLFSYTIGKSCIMNMMLDKACLNHLNYSKEICKNLSNYEVQKNEVEKLANVYGQYSTLISMGIGAISMIFIGPWSDRYGRKLPLILAVIGFTIYDIGLIVNTIYFDARLEYLLIPFLASGLTGGIICIFTTMFSLGSEMTTEKMRTVKYAIMEMSLGIGMSFGPITGGFLFKYYSYEVVFIVATAGHLIMLPWAIIFLQETRGLDVPSTVRWTEKIRHLFSLGNLSEGFKAYVKPRPNYGRLQLWLLLASICIIVLNYESFANIAYLYVYHKFNWGPTVYSIVNTTFSSVGLVVIVVFLTCFSRVLKIQDSMIGLIGTISLFLQNLCFAFAIYTWIYYLGSTVGLFSKAGTLIIRSRMSKIVGRDELGKIFSFLATCESLVPLAATVALTAIYNSSLSYFPGLVYLIMSILVIFPVLTFAWMLQLKTPDANSVTKDNPEVGDSRSVTENKDNCDI